MKLHLITLALALSSTAAYAAPGYDLAGNATSTAQTASTAGATNAGNAQSINSYAPSDTTVRSNPAIGIPSGAAAFSPFNCANVGSAGFSGGFFALGGSAAIESDECNGRANATILMQMANALSAMPSSDMHAMAPALVMSAIGVMCDQDDKLRAKLAGHGLCDHYDYDGNKRHYHVYRGDALGYYPE